MKLLSIIRSLVFFSFFITLINCSNGQVNFHEDNYELVNLTKVNNELIFYKPCDASIRRIIIRKDTLYYTTNQDGVYTYAIFEKEKLSNDKFSINSKTVGGRIESFSFTKKGQLWEVDGRLYAGKELENEFKYIKQPCLECFTEKECNEFVKNESKGKIDKEKTIDSNNTYNINKSKFTVSDKWDGAYYFKGGEFNLDYILYFSQEDIKLTTQARQYGYTDQLKAVQVGDTLGLYHHKNISGMNYDDTREYDFLKFYKGSDGKFYFEGELPYLPKGAIEFEKVK